MKMIKYFMLSAVAVCGFLVACTDIETKSISSPYTFDDAYYQNLRDYKASDHEIAFGWFAQYRQAASMASMATRFLGLPDSLDICSLWGGIPSSDDVMEEMRFVQKVKGTKMLVVAITRIQAEADSMSFKQAFNEAYAMEEGEARTQALYSAIEMYADYFLDQIFENDLDGFDADYEPEGDFLSGTWFDHFYEYMAQYLGPNPYITKQERLSLIHARWPKCDDTDKLLNIDETSTSMSELAEYSNYCFLQAYNNSNPSNGNWPAEKVVYCCNMGDNWSTDMSIMYAHARITPAGGFGAFYIHRDYKVHEYSAYPYQRFRECIQIQNPAVH